MTKKLFSPVESVPSFGRRDKMTINLHFHAVKTILSAKTSMKVVGVVSWGAEFGLLAIDDQCTYFRVNGTLLERLDQEQVNRELAKLRAWKSVRPDRKGQKVQTPFVELSIEKKKVRQLERQPVAKEMEQCSQNSGLRPIRIDRSTGPIEKRVTLGLGPK